MKNKMLFFSAALVVCATAAAQGKRPNYWAKQASSAALAFNSGFFARRAEIRKDDYRRYEARHPNANPQWANPRYSFKNKYEAYPTDQSPRYFMSKTVLVGFTLSLHEKPNIKTILLEAGKTWLFYGIGRAAADKFYQKVD